jgi:hypothetical protein
MYSHDYGNTHFSQKTSFKDIVVFSEIIKENTFEEQHALSNNLYVNVTQVEDSDNWIVDFDNRFYGEYGDNFLENNPNALMGEISQVSFIGSEASLLLENYAADFIEGNIKYYAIEGAYYIQLDGAINLDEVVLIGKTFKPKEKRKLERIVKKLDGIDAQATLFISNDGAQLERAYLNITKVLDREIVLFIETKEGTNIFGSVLRVKTGAGIDSTTVLPSRKIASIAKSFGHSVDTGYIIEMLKKHLKAKGTEKENSYFMLLKRIPLLGGRLIEVAADFTLQPLAEALDGVSKDINDNLKLSDNYWKATIDSKPNEAHAPLLPGYKIITETFKAEDLAKSIEQSYLNPFLPKVKTIIEVLKNTQPLNSFIGNKLKGIEHFINTLPEHLKTLLKTIQSTYKASFEFYNALIVGIINSLVDLLKAIFDILSLVCKGAYALIKESNKLASSPSAYFGTLIESLENGLDILISTFTIDNLKAFTGFQVYVVAKVIALGVTTFKTFSLKDTANATSNINIPFDAIGYYTGYIIGLIVQEILIFIATAGAGTLAEVLRGVLRSYVELGKMIATATGRLTRALNQTLTITIETFMQISRQLMAFAKQVPKHLETLKVWVDELLASLQSQLLINGNAFTFIDPFTPWVVNAIHKAGASKLLKAGISFYEHNGKYVVMYNAVDVGNYASKDELIKALQHLLSKNSDELVRYLDEVVLSKQALSKIEGLNDYRRKNKLPLYNFKDGATGTIAKIEVNGKSFYGINSSFTPDSLILRRKWFDKIKWVPPKKTQPLHLGHAQSLTHAEAHSLMSAIEELGKLPLKVTMYVDRPTCNICKGELPAIMKAMGIKELIIFIGNNKQSIKLTVNF